MVEEDLRAVQRRAAVRRRDEGRRADRRRQHAADDGAAPRRRRRRGREAAHPKRESKAAEEEQERLEAFIEDPPSHATIVFVCGPLDMRRRVVKLLLKEAQVVDCGTIETRPTRSVGEGARGAREGDVSSRPRSAALVERAGLDIVRLRAASSGWRCTRWGSRAITVDDVRQAVRPGRRRRPIWASPTRFSATTCVRRFASWGSRSRAVTSR